MLADIWFGLHWVLFPFFDHYIQSSVSVQLFSPFDHYFKSSVQCDFGSTFQLWLRMMLVGIWFSLYGVLSSFFDLYIHSSVQFSSVGFIGHHSISSIITFKVQWLCEVNEDGTTPLHVACRQNHPDMVRALLLGGGCRFKLTADTFYLRRGTAGDVTPLGITTNPDVRTLFASGIDYWQRKHHAHHSWAMKQVVLTLVLVAQRMGAHADITQPLTLPGDAHTSVQHQPPSLPRLPEEIWLELLGFLRSADSRA